MSLKLRPRGWRVGLLEQLSAKDVVQFPTKPLIKHEWSFKAATQGRQPTLA